MSRASAATSGETVSLADRRDDPPAAAGRAKTLTEAASAEPGGPPADPAKTRDLRLVFLSNQVPHYRLSTLTAMAARVRELSVILTSGLVAGDFRASGVPILEVDTLRLRLRRRHPSGYAERYELHLPYGILRALRRIRPDAIFAAELGPRTISAVLYRMLFNRRCVLVIHADLSEHTELGRGRLRRSLRRWLAAHADLIAVNGHSGARYVAALGVPADRLVGFPYPTDRERFCAPAAPAGRTGPKRLLYVGRLVELKGLEPFIEALGRALALHPDARVELVLAGDGDRRERLQQMPLPGNLTLRFAGHVPYDALPALYRDADVFVMPSLGDTWGMVVNEAMASRLPVLGSQRAQAVQELIGQDARCGWTFDPADVASLEAAIDRMLQTDRDTLRTMGEAARNRALALDPQRLVDALLDRIDAVRDAGAERGRT